MLESSRQPKPSKLFTRRQYIKIADTLYTSRRVMPAIFYDYIVTAFSRMLKRDNPNFDINNFHRQCYHGE